MCSISNPSPSASARLRRDKYSSSLYEGERRTPTPAVKKVPLSRVFVNDEVRDAGMRAMNSGWYILAKECEAFEAELAAYVGTKEAVLCSSWTTGALMLHHAMGVCPGDEILVPSHTAFPSIEPMIHRGAKPIFIDIDETYCIDVDLLESATTARTGPPRSSSKSPRSLPNGNRLGRSLLKHVRRAVTTSNSG